MQFAELEAWAARSRWEPGWWGWAVVGVDREWAQTIQPHTGWMSKLASRGQQQKPEKEKKKKTPLEQNKKERTENRFSF